MTLLPIYYFSVDGLIFADIKLAKGTLKQINLPVLLELRREFYSKGQGYS